MQGHVGKVTAKIRSRMCSKIPYGRKIPVWLFWWIAEISVFGGIYFGSLAMPVP